MTTTAAGEAKAWDLLAASDPAGVCARAGVDIVPAGGGYRVPAFGRLFCVDPDGRRILGLDTKAEDFLQRHDSLFRLSVLWYLVRATAVRPSGRLVRPAGLPGGEIFLKGTHVLPLDELAAACSARPEALVAAGRALGGAPAAFGDAAVVLWPLPKVPTTTILWAGASRV